MTEKRTASKSTWISKLLRNNTFLIGMVLVLLIVTAIVATPFFLNPFNLQSLMRDLAIIALIALGQTMLLLIGELDLSIGASATLSGIFAGLLITQTGLPPMVSFFIGISAGLVLGCLNGIIVTKFRISSMVTTVGMSGVYTGIALVITRGRAIIGIPEYITVIGRGTVMGVPIQFIIALCMMVLVTIFVNKTRTGRYIYAIGNSKPAAQILGIKVDTYRILMFSLTGLFAAMAGMITLARIGSAQAVLGAGWPMNSIAASVIGGIWLTGGVGNPIGAVIGATILTVISNIIVLLGVDIYFQSAVNGIVVVIAIALPSVINMVRERNHIKAIAKQKSQV